MIQSDIRTEFEQAADDWQSHCDSVVFSSNIDDFVRHPTFDKLVALGPAAIPHMIERYKKDSLPWGFVLQDITGEKFIPDRNNFRPADVWKKWLDWWTRRQ